MARLRYNGLTATLGADLAAGDTTIAFAAALTSAAGAVPTISGSDAIALTILDAAGAVAEIVSLTAYTSGATTGTIARAQESTTAAVHTAGANIIHAPTASDFASGAVGGVSAGSILAVAEATTSAAYSTTSGTDVDIDATNLTVTFTAPDSGKVFVELEGYCGINAIGGLQWTLRSPAGATLATVSVHANGATNLDRRQVRIRMTGLTPGALVTYRWGWYAGGGSGGTISMYTGGNSGTSGNAQMLVTAAP